MKIGIISTYSNACPPIAYGGESFYWQLAKGLGERGHEVHLFAPGGSETPPNGYLHLIPSTSGGAIKRKIEDDIVRMYADTLIGMDVVHDCSLDLIPSERIRSLYGKKEVIVTMNGSLYSLLRPPVNVVTGSKFWQNDAAAAGVKTEMVYWGVDTKFYTPEYEKEDYLLWIARFHPDKGIHIALELAEVLGFKLKIAGSMQFRDHAVYGKQFKQWADKIPNVEYVELPLDSTHHDVKIELMQKARAFLYPVNYKECFGLVVAEAMACGTPVITTPNGAMPELVDDGVNGFICRTKHEFYKAIMEKLPHYWEMKNHHPGFDLWKSSREKAEQFDVSNAVTAYEKLYHRVIKGETW